MVNFHSFLLLKKNNKIDKYIRKYSFKFVEDELPGSAEVKNFELSDTSDLPQEVENTDKGNIIDFSLEDEEIAAELLALFPNIEQSSCVSPVPSIYASPVPSMSSTPVPGLFALITLTQGPTTRQRTGNVTHKLLLRPKRLHQ